MAMVKKSITVTDQQDAWIRAQIASGDYSNDSEVIRDALRDKQRRIAELEALRAKINEGLESGISHRTPHEIMESVIDKKRRDGEL